MIDITRALGPNTAAWPGDSPFELAWTMRMARGDSVDLSRISTSPHVGTHVDAPAHYLEDGARADELDLDALIGPVRVVDLRGCDRVTIAALESAGLAGRRLSDPPRMLVRVLTSDDPTRFPDAFATLDPGTAETLAATGLRLYGTDAPSVDPVDSTILAAHRALAMPILENLDLREVAPGLYDLVALPLRLADAEAAPLRAVLLAPGSLDPADGQEAGNSSHHPDMENVAE